MGLVRSHVSCWFGMVKTKGVMDYSKTHVEDLCISLNKNEELQDFQN